MSTSTAAQSSASAEAVAHYTRRAEKYDGGDGGWHVTLAQRFVDEVNPGKGAHCLDLACGTGLVTFPLAQAAGKGGLVIGVDITPAMLDIARKQPREEDWAPIDFLEHDITELDAIPAISSVVADHGGFDVISCCSALVLLADPAAAIKSWARLLKPGGRFITDVPTEKHTLQYIFSWQLRNAMGLKNEFNRSWVEDIHSLEKLCVDAGLVIEKSWVTGNQMPDKKEYRVEDGEAVFEDHLSKYSEFMNLDKAGETKEKFLEMWRRECEKGGGVFRDGHWLYVTVARKEG